MAHTTFQWVEFLFPYWRSAALCMEAREFDDASQGTRHHRRDDDVRIMHTSSSDEPMVHRKLRAFHNVEEASTHAALRMCEALCAKDTEGCVPHASTEDAKAWTITVHRRPALKQRKKRSALVPPDRKWIKNLIGIMSGQQIGTRRVYNCNVC